jgi:hypothetical protein
MFREFLAQSFSFAAVLTIGMTLAVAGPVVDLSVPQTDHFPSVLDISNGEAGNWGKNENVEGSFSLAIVGSQGSPATSGGAAKTQSVSGYFRKGGTYVHSYVRSSRR